MTLKHQFFASTGPEVSLSKPAQLRPSIRVSSGATLLTLKALEK